MLLESEFGKSETADFAIIDYFGDYRQIQIRPQDRKKVFRAVRKIREIKNGKMPKEKNIRLCQKCIYQKKCQVKAKSLLSKLFE
jgi:RecB family exonuclease